MNMVEHVEIEMTLLQMILNLPEFTAFSIVGDKHPKLGLLTIVKIRNPVYSSPIHDRFFVRNSNRQ